MKPYNRTLICQLGTAHTPPRSLIFFLLETISMERLAKLASHLEPSAGVTQVCSKLTGFDGLEGSQSSRSSVSLKCKGNYL